MMAWPRRVEEVEVGLGQLTHAVLVGVLVDPDKHPVTSSYFER